MILLGVLAACAPARARAEAGATDLMPRGACDGRPISRVEIEPRNIFDPLPPGRMAPLFDLANRLHIRTRQQTVREQVLFGPGEVWHDRLRQETARSLRALGFLQPSQITARCDSDSVVVHVVTRDVWSTQLDFSLESSGGTQYGSLGLTERNFAGLGKSLSISYRDLPGGRARAMGYSDPSLLGTRVRAHVGSSTGANGASDEFSLGQPFYREDATRSYVLSWSRSTSVSALYENANEVATFNRRYEQVELAMGAGRRSARTVERLTGYFDAWDRRLGPTHIEASSLPPEFIGGEESVRIRRFSLEGRLWQPSYIERTRINGFGLVEDFDLGPSATLRAGWASKLLGSSQNEGYLRAKLDGGVSTPFGFGTLTTTGETRFKTELFETTGSVDARWYQPSTFGQTLVLAARGVAGDNVGRDFQAVVGGLSGLRAYPVAALAGHRLWRLNAENRWTAGVHYWESVTVGAVTFVDAARAWGPGSGGAKWFVDAGAGLRIVLPQWSLGQALRFDVAWPVQPTRDGARKPVLSFGSSQAF